MGSFTRQSGRALVGGATLLILLNVILTPLLPVGDGDAATRASTVYLFRLSGAVVSALLLLFGSIGVYIVHLRHRRSGRFGGVAFAVLFLGQALLVALEWSNVFILRPLAQIAPAALDQVGQATLLVVGSAGTAGLFALGWLLVSACLLLNRAAAGWIPLAIITGLVASVALAVSPLGPNGAIVGTVVFGVGLIGLGRGVIERAAWLDA